MREKFTLTVLIFLFFSSILSAQNVLMLEKAGTNKKVFFKSGDEIRYKLKGEDHYRKDHIVSLKDSSIIFHYNKIGVEEISEIDIRKKDFIKFNLKKTGTVLQISGAVYILLDQFNKTVVQGNDWEFEGDVWITGAILVGVGTAIKFLHPKKFKVGGKYKLHIIDINYVYQ